MSEPHCPNYATCQLINGVVEVSDNQKKSYTNNFCFNPKERWNECKRMVTKRTLGFCPDFVLPDSTLTVDEIMDKFDSNE
jgi:hypothetical protein